MIDPALQPSLSHGTLSLREKPNIQIAPFTNEDRSVQKLLKLHYKGLVRRYCASACTESCESWPHLKLRFHRASDSEVPLEDVVLYRKHPLSRRNSVMGEGKPRNKTRKSGSLPPVFCYSTTE